MNLDTDIGLYDKEERMSSSATLVKDGNGFSISKGQEGNHLKSQKIISIQIKKMFEAKVTLGEMHIDYPFVLQSLQKEDYEAVEQYAIRNIMKKLSDPSLMAIFIEVTKETAYDKGYATGRNKLRSDLGKLIFEED